MTNDNNVADTPSAVEMSTPKPLDIMHRKEVLDFVTAAANRHDSGVSKIIVSRLSEKYE